MNNEELTPGLLVIKEPTQCCSVVIPTKNGGQLFKLAIEALKKQNAWANTELIIIDSGSTDGTVEAARAANAKVVEISPRDFNHGSTRDLGISMASCELVVLMVQDAVAEKTDLLEAILQPFDDPEVAGVYARQKPQPQADLLTKRNLNSWMTGRLDREVRKLESLEWYESLLPMGKYLFCNFDNVCSAIRKSVWKEQKFGVIGFGEDIDWAERVLKMGHKIVYEPTAVVIHSHSRPMSYEYKRTYVCHRKLYQKFGLQLVPSLTGAIISWFHSVLSDTKYITIQHSPSCVKLSLWANMLILNLLSTIAQYRAARDEASGNAHKVVGV
ncbi:MAG: glycosyltransferase [Desulfobulbaceae bacterium]|nr:glycosyltransferase [Desulfobulbaceae bacterium]